jgi:ADP-ribose pyrophosphatase YjhB (NUDIX family)
MFAKIINLFFKLVKHKYVIAGVPVIIRNSSGKILLGKRTNKPIFYSGFWGLPGGMIEYDESIENAGKREVKEELGVEIKIIRRASNIYESFPNENCQLHLMSIPVYASILRGIPKAKDETLEVKWFKPQEIKKMKLAYNHNKILVGEGIVK